MYGMLETQSGPSTTPAPRDPVLSTLLAQLPVGVVIANRDGALEVVNDFAKALFAQHRRRSAAEPWVARAGLASDACEPIDWAIARTLLTGELIRDEAIQFLDSRDEWRTLSVSATPLEDARSEITSALVTFVDVTDVNRAKEWEPLIRSISRL
jgi:nitrogen fixation/metabolism regulation signal transduction histidine kinase